MSGHLMVIGAHISDAENMAGAVMLKHRRAGWDVTMVHMTPGEKGHPTLSAADYLAMRQADAAASAAFIGAQVEILPYHDAELAVTDESVWQVADLIRRYCPTVVITHWRGSFHPDHNHTHDIVQAALFRSGLQAFRREHPAHSPDALYFAENWEDMTDYSPDIYLDVTDVFDDYLALLQTHALMREGYSSFRYYDYYAALGRMRGALGGFDRAVTLMRPRGPYAFARKPGLLTE